MKSKSIVVIVTVFVLASMMLSACASATPVATEAPTAAATTAAATVAATAAPTTDTASQGKHLLWTKDLREAVAAAIDREALNDRVFEGRNIPAYSMVPSSYPGATEPFSDKYGTRNLDLAKQLLTKSGFTADKPLDLELWYPPDHYGTNTADVMQVIKEQLEETGLIKVDLKTQAWAQYIGESVPQGKLGFFILGWFPDFADQETWLTPFASCNQSPDQGVNYCNADMDKLLSSARTETDSTKRIDLYKQVGQLYADEVPTLPLFWEPEFITGRNGVNGIAIASTFEFNYFPLNFSADYKPASGDKNTIIIGTTDQLDSLDPADAYSTSDWEILKNTGVPLMKYDPGKTELVPGSASGYKVSDDGKTYTFTLRTGMKYADGTTVKASDYLAQWNRLTNLKGQVASLITNYVDSVEAPDDVTVVYHLKDAIAFFPAVAATPPFVAVNPKDFPVDKLVSFPTVLDGNGPYRMTSFKENEQLVLEANPNYFGDVKPAIQKVIIKFYSQPSLMSQAVEKGEIDIAWRILGAVEANRLSTVSGVTVTKIEAPALRYLVFNDKYEVGQ